jgi:sulfoxide reductase heme-binding subunit YedZ
MNPQFWWYLSRAAGVVGWLFLTASVLWGILLSTKLFPAHRRPAWLLDLHRALGGLALLTIAVHLGALVADNYVHFTLVDLTIPFASDWKTWQVALGVIAFWGVVVVEGTSLAMKHLPRRVWRGVHMFSYVTFLLTSLHGTFAGTDATNRLYVATTIVTTVVLLFAIVHRIVHRGDNRPAAVGRETTGRSELPPPPRHDPAAMRDESERNSHLSSHG